MDAEPTGVQASVYEAQLHAQPERRQAVLGGWEVFTADDQTLHASDGEMYIEVTHPRNTQSGNALMAVVLKPPSTYSTSPLIPEARPEHRKAAALPISSIVTLRRKGVLRAL